MILFITGNPCQRLQKNWILIKNHQSEMAGGFLMYFGRWCDLIVAKVSLEGVSVTGHAGYSESGNDIVCAAVSALVQGL